MWRWSREYSAGWSKNDNPNASVVHCYPPQKDDQSHLNSLHMLKKYFKLKAKWKVQMMDALIINTENDDITAERRVCWSVLIWGIS